MNDDIATPEMVERRLRSLGRELDAAYNDLVESEKRYAEAKSDFEIAIAGQRMGIRGQALERGVKLTIQEIEDHALLHCAEEFTNLNIAEAFVKSARANNTRIRTQIDIARSVGTSVRAAMDIS